MKICITCKESKGENEFHLHRAGGTKRRSECKRCTADRARQRAAGIRNGEIVPKTRPQPTGKTKECTKCETKRDVNEFDRDSRASDGLHSQCKPCRAEANRLYIIGERNAC